MPSYIVKADKDTDLYVIWSTIVDSPLSWGQAEDFPEENPERFERANRTGSSSFDGFFNWDDEEFYLRELGTKHEDYMLPRVNLKDFLVFLSEDPGNPEHQQRALDLFCNIWNPED